MLTLNVQVCLEEFEHAEKLAVCPCLHGFQAYLSYNNVYRYQSTEWLSQCEPLIAVFTLVDLSPVPVNIFFRLVGPVWRLHPPWMPGCKVSDSGVTDVGISLRRVTKTECGYLNGWIEIWSHMQKSSGPSISILRLGEIAHLTCSFYLSVATHTTVSRSIWEAHTVCFWDINKPRLRAGCQSSHNSLAKKWSQCFSR